ncbi:MAG: DUF177 domain-containing protein [Phenylobacterium sp.]
MSDTILRLSRLRGPLDVELAPDADARAAIAKRLKLISLPALSARLTVRPWLDGAEIAGRFEAVVEQECGVTLDPFQQPLSGDIEMRVVPEGSPHAPAADSSEVELDSNAPDPPDVLAGDELDLTEYLVEHLALEIDPFPRKPGAEFEYRNAEDDDSPFAVLKGMRTRES